MHTLTFTDDEMVVIDRALGDMPYRLAAPVIASINQQLAARVEDDALGEPSPAGGTFRPADSS